MPDASQVSENAAVTASLPRHGTPGSLPARARWYLNRLRCMSRAEIGHRLGRALRARSERLGIGPRPAVKQQQPDLGRCAAPWLAPTPDIDPGLYVAAADRIASGKLDIFAMRAVDYGLRPDWNRDPVTGIVPPLAFGKLLDYRDPTRVGDIKHLWEPNRHLQLVALAQAYALTGQQRHLDVLRTQLDHWFSSCPCPRGPNWTSALEAGIRLVNWAIAWQLIGGPASAAFAGADGARFRARWLGSVREHVEFIRGYYSLYSSANNHLIGEAAGVLVAAATWPHWPETDTWLDEASSILERETLLQNARDGVNREQAVAYAQFELDLLLLALLAGTAAGRPPSPACRARIEAMLEHIAAIMDVAGHVPAFGDSDDGHVVRLSAAPGHCPFRSVLAAGALLFERADFASKVRSVDDKTRWLLGDDAVSRFAALAAARASAPARRRFSNGGYYVLGAELDTPSEVRLVADAGPLGYGSIAAHGHADALSFTLSIGGAEIFIDPGTFTYRPDGPWRAYFRGTSAHNTVRIDGLDQSEPGGNFMWLDKAEAGCTRFEPGAERDVFEGWHDGYRRLADPVVHCRRIEIDKLARRIVIEDRIEARAEHDVELMFHCSPDCSVEAARGGGFRIVNGPAEVRLRTPRLGRFEAELCRGRIDPPLGWAAPRFGEKRPAPTICWRARLGPARFVSLIDY